MPLLRLSPPSLLRDVFMTHGRVMVHELNFSRAQLHKDGNLVYHIHLPSLVLDTQWVLSMFVHSLEKGGNQI